MSSSPASIASSPIAGSSATASIYFTSPPPLLFENSIKKRKYYKEYRAKKRAERTPQQKVWDKKKDRERKAAASNRKNEDISSPTTPRTGCSKYRLRRSLLSSEDSPSKKSKTADSPSKSFGEAIDELGKIVKSGRKMALVKQVVARHTLKQAGKKPSNTTIARLARCSRSLAAYYKNRLQQPHVKRRPAKSANLMKMNIQHKRDVQQFYRSAEISRPRPEKRFSAKRLM